MKITKLKDKILTTLAAAIVILIMYVFDLSCPFLSLFDIPCPGCGMTRAYISLLNLNVKGAFSFHPMFWSVPILFAFYLFDGKIFRPKWVNALISTAIYAGFFVLWIFRLTTA